MSSGTATMAVSGPEGLHTIETMLRDIGAPSPAAQLKEQQKVANTSNIKRSTAASQQKDCLAAEARQTFQTPKFDHSRSRMSESPNSMMKGAHMAGKDPDHLRFYGKGFTMPPRESPGPIYQPKQQDSGADQGRSFSRAARMSEGNTSTHSASGPNTTLPGTIGAQVESNSKTAPSVSFTKGKRFNSKEFISREHGKGHGAADTPAPTQYAPDVVTKADKNKGASFSGSRGVPTSKIFISRAHIADCVGQSSPGPCYMPQDVRGYTPPSSFGHSSGPKSVHEDGHPRAQSVQPFISREHAKSMPQLSGPGPAAYDPKLDVTKPNSVSVSFCHDHGTEKRFISKELSTTKGKESPGPKYFYNDNAVRKASPVTTLGSKTGEPSTTDRFASKMFVGKGMGEVRGGASPGPAYNPVHDDKGPSFSMVHKERHFPKSIFPGPSRSRFVMKDLAKENMGAFSPGPKYDVGTKQFGNDAPAAGFGTSDRYFGEGFSEEHRAKFGTAEKPYTSPAEARFVSREFSKSAMAGKCSSGPKYSPKDDICSGNKRAPTTVIAKSNTTSRKPPLNSGPKPKLTYAKFDVVSADKRSHAFPKAERMPASKTTQGPGPTAYDPKFKLVEKRVIQDVSIGELA